MLACMRALGEITAVRDDFCANGDQQDAHELLVLLLDQFFSGSAAHPFDVCYHERLTCERCGGSIGHNCSSTVVPLDFPAGAAAGDRFAVQDLLGAFLAAEAVEGRCGGSPSVFVGCGCENRTRNRAWIAAPHMLALQATRVHTVRLASAGAPPGVARHKVLSKLLGTEEVRLDTLGGAVHYDLVACVCHSGPSMQCGHYTCNAKAEGRWLSFDDETVCELQAPIADGAADAYLLFYRRRGA